MKKFQNSIISTLKKINFSLRQNYPRFSFHCQMCQHDCQTRSTDDSSEFPDSSIRLIVSAEGDEEDDQGLVQRVKHVQPERMTLVDLQKIKKN